MELDEAEAHTRNLDSLPTAQLLQLIEENRQVFRWSLLRPQVEALSRRSDNTTEIADLSDSERRLLPNGYAPVIQDRIEEANAAASRNADWLANS